MKSFKKVDGIDLPKNQAILFNFIQSGRNDFIKAFPQRKRKNRTVKQVLFFASWFNRQLKRIQKRNLLMDIPFIYHINGSFIWANPGVRGSKSNFQALTLHDAQMELKSEINKIL